MERIFFRIIPPQFEVDSEFYNPDLHYLQHVRPCAAPSLWGRQNFKGDAQFDFVEGAHDWSCVYAWQLLCLDIFSLLQKVRR